MRHFDKGALVGEQNPPVDFEQWLRGELAQVRQINTRDSLAPGVISVNARKTALLEVLAAFNDSKRSS